MMDPVLLSGGPGCRNCDVCHLPQPCAGICQERAIATVFGRTGVTDVFFAAFAIPDLMYQLLVGGVISSAFIPVFTQYLARMMKSRPGMWPAPLLTW